MRIALLCLVVFATSFILGCAKDDPNRLEWDQRTVPMTGHEKATTGTGDTSNLPGK